MEKKSKRIFFTGLKDVAVDLDKGELGSAKRKLGMLEINLSKNMRKAKSFDKNFFKRSLRALKPLKKMI